MRQTKKTHPLLFSAAFSRTKGLLLYSLFLLVLGWSASGCDTLSPPTELAESTAEIALTESFQPSDASESPSEAPPHESKMDASPQETHPETNLPEPTHPPKEGDPEHFSPDILVEHPPEISPESPSESIPETPTESPPRRPLVLHFKKPVSWGAPSIHFWATDPQRQASTWPGILMTDSGDGWVHYAFAQATSASFVFNDPTTKEQTIDLSRSREGWFVLYGKDDVGKSIGRWYDRDPDKLPILQISPTGGDFYEDTLEVAFDMLGPPPTTARYTLDGSDPSTQGISFTKGQSIRIGNGLAIGQSITLRIFLQHAQNTFHQSHTFTKRPPQTKRPWDPNDKPQSTEVKGRFVWLKDFNNPFGLANRHVVLYLPPDYSTASQRRYRVIYFHDGQNLFQKQDSSFGMEWKVDEALDALLTEDLIDPAIVVGIYNTGSTRSIEYVGTLAADKKAQYSKWIVEHLKPYIDHHYRTLHQSAYTTVMGSSFGGIISIYLSWNYPQTFGAAGCVSNSFRENGAQFLADLLAYQGPKKPVRYWIDAGYEEGEKYPDGRAWYLANNRRFAEKLAALGHKDNEDLAYFEAVGADHSETAWSLRIKKILYFLLRKQTPHPTRIQLRTSLPFVPSNGKAYASVDLHYENDFHLTRTFSQHSPSFLLQTTAPSILTVDTTQEGLLTPKSLGVSDLIVQEGPFSHTLSVPVR